MADLLQFCEDDINRPYQISKLALNEWKDFAAYTVSNRAIPSMIDGLKPVQRFYLYSSLVNSRREFRKVSAVSGVVSDYGYNHGETSAASTGQGMAAEWANNICLVEGRGSFGSRLIQAAGAPRYVYTRVHPNFDTYIRDIDISPEHSDPEHEPPKFYIPVIPLVLANGTKGIATGFSTTILPRDPKELVKACRSYIKTGKVKDRIRVKFPHFKGHVEFKEEEGRFYVHGVMERSGKTKVIISEVPYGYDREKYVKVLDKLEDDGMIVGYEDQCNKDGFKFEVKLKLSLSKKTDDQLKQMFKLVAGMSENINVIGPDWNLREYQDERQLIIDFCEFRKTVLQKRIDKRKMELNEELRWLRVKLEFILAVLDNEIVFKNKKKTEVGEQILQHTSANKDDIERLLRINIMSLTLEMVDELKDLIAKAKKNLEYWESTTVDAQFLEDLDSIK